MLMRGCEWGWGGGGGEVMWLGGLKTGWMVRLGWCGCLGVG